MKPEGCKYAIGDKFYDHAKAALMEIVGFKVIDDEIQYILAPLSSHRFEIACESELDALGREA